MTTAPQETPDYPEQIPLEEEQEIYARESPSTEELITKNTIENFFDTEGILLRVEKTMRGYQIRDGEYVKVGDELARDVFIDKMINSLRSVINPSAMISKLKEDEIKDILMEKNEEFIDACNDEVTVHEDDISHIIDLHDFQLQIFMGHLKDGHGSKIVRQLGGNLYVPEKEPEQKTYALGGMFSGFGGKK